MPLIIHEWKMKSFCNNSVKVTCTSVISCSVTGTFTSSKNCSVERWVFWVWDKAHTQFLEVCSRRLTLALCVVCIVCFLVWITSSFKGLMTTKRLPSVPTPSLLSFVLPSAEMDGDKFFFFSGPFWLNRRVSQVSHRQHLLQFNSTSGVNSKNGN